MSKRGDNESKEHENLVSMMAKYYSTKGYVTIKADLNEYANKPDKINGYVPDVIAEGKAPFIILEAETCDSIDIEHTELQFKAFDKFVKQNGGEFHIAVPRQCYEIAVAKINKMGLKATVWQPEK